MSLSLDNKKIEIAGQVVGGSVTSILVRQKSDQNIELGDFSVADIDESSYLILKVNDLAYGSQIPGFVRELAAGLKLEGYSAGIDFMDPKLRNYVCASVKPIAKIFLDKKDVKIPKVMPPFFTSIRFATEKDMAFLSVPPKNPVYLGQVRSGSKTLDVPVYLDGDLAFTHHILIPATTGRGKSNLLKVILWSLMDVGKVGILVLDPHDEYYGRDGLGLKDHPKAPRHLVYYSSDAVMGKNTLVVNLETLGPDHFEGIISFTDAQQDAIASLLQNLQIPVVAAAHSRHLSRRDHSQNDTGASKKVPQGSRCKRERWSNNLRHGDLFYRRWACHNRRDHKVARSGENRGD